MREIIKNLYIGTVEDYEKVYLCDDFYVIGAAKEPFHRSAVGYSGRACSAADPEYLWAERKNILACNLIDARDVRFIPGMLIAKILHCIDRELENGKKVLVCCNQGHSRSAVIGMMYLRQKGKFVNDDFESCEKEYKRIYPEYEPNSGIRDFAYIRWDDLPERNETE